MESVASSFGPIATMFQNKKVNENARAAATEAEKYESQLTQMEQNRQDVTNPYANLGVATKAAEMKMAEADQSLASALDAIRATGGGAASATALARAAAQSKQTIAGDIEQQEVNNQAKFAEGEIQKQSVQEERDMAKMDRLASLGEGYRQREMDAIAAEAARKSGNIQAGAKLGGAVLENLDEIKSLF